MFPQCYWSLWTQDGSTRLVKKNQIPKLPASYPLNLQRSICPASLWLVHCSRAYFLSAIERSAHHGNTCLVLKNHIAKLSTTHLLNLQRSIFLAELWLAHPSRAYFLRVIEPSEHDGKTGKTVFVQKNHILKLSITNPLNLQRSICLTSAWLAHPSTACLFRVIGPSEQDGKSRVVHKNHIAKLSTTHPLNLQRSIFLTSL